MRSPILGMGHWTNQFIVVVSLFSICLADISWLSKFSLKILLLISYSCSAIIILSRLLLLLLLLVDRWWMCNSLAWTLSIVIDFTKNHRCCRRRCCYHINPMLLTIKSTVRKDKNSMKIYFLCQCGRRNKCSLIHTQAEMGGSRVKGLANVHFQCSNMYQWQSREKKRELARAFVWGVMCVRLPFITLRCVFVGHTFKC